MHSSRSFSNFYTLEQYAAYRTCFDSAPRDAGGGMLLDGEAYEAWSAAYGLQSDTLHRQVLEFLLSKAKASQLVKVDYATGRGHAFSNQWNELVAGRLDGSEAEYLTRPIGSAIIRGAGLAAPDETLPADYAAVCDQADKGDFAWFDLDSRQACVVTGEQLCVEMSNWRPALGVLDHKNRQEPFTRLKGELPAPTVSHNVIDAPSGELLISDWIRIDAFTKLVTAGREAESLGSAAGRARRTQQFAEKFGFMCVSVGNTVPSIVQRDGQLVFARVDEDAGTHQGEVVGYVCTDHWAVTVIDRQVLTELLTGAIGREAAEKEVAEAVSSNRSELTRVQVCPGKLHIYNTGNETGLSGFVSGQVDTTAVKQVFAVLSESELAWSPKGAAPAPARRPRMR